MGVARHGWMDGPAEPCALMHQPAWPLPSTPPTPPTPPPPPPPLLLLHSSSFSRVPTCLAPRKVQLAIALSALGLFACNIDSSLVLPTLHPHPHSHPHQRQRPHPHAPLPSRSPGCMSPVPVPVPVPVPGLELGRRSG